MATHLKFSNQMGFFNVDPFSSADHSMSCFSYTQFTDGENQNHVATCSGTFITDLLPIGPYHFKLNAGNKRKLVTDKFWRVNAGISSNCNFHYSAEESKPMSLIKKVLHFRYPELNINISTKSSNDKN